MWSKTMECGMPPRIYLRIGVFQTRRHNRPHSIADGAATCRSDPRDGAEIYDGAVLEFASARESADPVPSAVRPYCLMRFCSAPSGFIAPRLSFLPRSATTV